MAQFFSARLKALLKERGLSQKELAVMTGLTPPAISRYITGERMPRAIVIAKIAKALGVHPDDLTGTNHEQAVNEAVQLLARNANSLSDSQKEQLIKMLIRR